MNEFDAVGVELKIFRIVEDHSGGMKFTELIAEFMVKHKEYLSTEQICSLPEILEKVIRDSEGRMKVLDYTWKQMNRAKMFVYTP